MNKKVIIVAIVVFLLIGAVAFIVSGREKEEIHFIAVVTEMDVENNVAYASYAARFNNDSKPLFAKKLPEDITFDTRVALEKDDIITAFCLASSIDGNHVDVYDLTVSEPVQ